MFIKYQINKIFQIIQFIRFYFICSREEGGRKGQVKLCHNVTVIANNVGMVDTLINNKKMVT